MRKIGEIIKFQGHRLKVTSQSECENCFFIRNHRACTSFRNNVECCSSLDREDELSVNFIKLYFKYGK
jgi:hypothetical protein